MNIESENQCDLCAEPFSTPEKYCDDCMEDHSYCDGCEVLVNNSYVNETRTGICICFECASVLMKAWRTDF